MAYATGETTRFEQAKALATQLVKDTRRGDAISVVLMADPPRVVIGDPSPNHAEVLKEIDEITLPHGGTDLAASFARDRPRPRRLDDPPEGGRLPDRPPGRQLAQARGETSDDGLKRALAKLAGAQAPLGRDRPGQGRRREPRRHRPAAQHPDRHRGGLDA